MSGVIVDAMALLRLCRAACRAILLGVGRFGGSQLGASGFFLAGVDRRPILVGRNIATILYTVNDLC
jgi:hypothetical protein